MEPEDDCVLTDALLARLDQAFEAAAQEGGDPAAGLAAVLQELDATVRSRPADPRLREEFAFWLDQLEDWLWGISFERCEDALCIGTEAWHAVYLHATHRLEAEETEEAVAAFRYALTLVPGAPFGPETATRWGLGAALREQGDPRARAQLARVLALLGDAPGQALLRRLRAGRRLLARLEGPAPTDP
jgi:hypothetical protein